MTTYEEIGTIIGKYLKETYRLKSEYLQYSDYDIGVMVWNSSPHGELLSFFILMEEARQYYNIADWVARPELVKRIRND